jgi:hypothetical protein
MNFRSLIESKTLRYVGLTILLGAVGSGAWDWMLKPALVGVSTIGLQITTLGLRSLKDLLYSEIAQGFHEEPSLRFYLFAFGLVPIGLVGFVFGVLATRGRFKASLDKALSDTVIAKMERFMLILFVFLAVFSALQANEVAYVNRAITHLRQVMAIAGPYISEGDRKLYLSRFAQISSRDDYAALVSTLEQICKEKNLKVPKFAIW